MKWGKGIESEDEKTASYRSMDFIRNISGVCFAISCSSQKCWEEPIPKEATIIILCP